MDNSTKNNTRKIHFHMENFVTYHNYFEKLHNDITTIFPSPVLAAALKPLQEYIEIYTESRLELRQAGYSMDDVFTHFTQGFKRI